MMACWLTDVYLRESWDAHLVVPVPLSAKRYRERGYNQAGLIASSMADKLGIPYLRDGLLRIRDTPSQVGLNPAQRKMNIRDAIQGNTSAFNDKSILLVDDLITTGATIIACARAVEESGAKYMYVLAVGLAEVRGSNSRKTGGEAP